MLKARAGDMLVIGLEKDNVKRLKKGEAIHFGLGELGGEGSVLIVYGDNKLEVANELKKLGLKVPNIEDIPKSTEGVSNEKH